ncbi:MAG: 2-keto-4-pentenoate hydratase [Alphaproteobacteria bacterium]
MTATSPRADKLAEILFRARQDGALLERVAEHVMPADEDEAYDAQDALGEYLGLYVAGWKIGATTTQVQKAIGMSEPFSGRIIAGTVYRSGIELAAGKGHNILEAEFAVRLARDLAGEARPYTADDLRGAIHAIHPCIEINRPSFKDPFKMSGLAVIADNGSNAGIVLGEAIENWQRVDLAAASVEFRKNDAVVARGVGANVMAHPFNALAWLANKRAARGDYLRRGQFIATGSLMGFVACAAGDGVAAEFGKLGTVKLRLI